MPVIACIGIGRDGQLFNVNADTLAGHLAARLGARRLVIAGTTAGVLDGMAATMPALDAGAVEALVSDGTATAGMIAKLRACEQALAGGVDDVVIVDGREAETLTPRPRASAGVGDAAGRERRREAGLKAALRRTQSDEQLTQNAGRRTTSEETRTPNEGIFMTMVMDDVVAREARHVLQTYKRNAVTLVRGQGVRLYDADGREYSTCCRASASPPLGHAHPGLARAIADQAQTLIHTSNLFYHPLQGQLAERLAPLSGLPRAFFCNSGTEAVEACLKFARRYWYTKGEPRPGVHRARGLVPRADVRLAVGHLRRALPRSRSSRCCRA